MKGFLHLVEIVMIIMLLFVVLIQLVYVPISKGDWASVKLELQANDAINILEEEGINWFNGTKVDEKLSEILGKNVLYKVDILNVPKSSIVVGCICNQSELATAGDMLSGTVLNGRDISFSIKAIDPTDVTFPRDTNVIVEWGRNLSAYYDQLGYYLEDGGSIIDIKTPSQSDVGSIYNDYFGIDWNASLSYSSSELEFTALGPESSAYPIYRYFYYTPNSSGGYFEDPHSFSYSLGNSRMYPIAGRGVVTVLEQPGTGRTGCIVNPSTMSNGKAAWIIGGDDSLEERKTLLKDVVIWSAGLSENVVNARVVYSPVKASLYKVLYADFFEPYEVVLTASNLY